MALSPRYRMITAIAAHVLGGVWYGPEPRLEGDNCHSSPRSLTLYTCDSVSDRAYIRLVDSARMTALPVQDLAQKYSSVSEMREIIFQHCPGRIFAWCGDKPWMLTELRWNMDSGLLECILLCELCVITLAKQTLESNNNANLHIPEVKFNFTPVLWWFGSFSACRMFTVARSLC